MITGKERWAILGEFTNWLYSESEDFPENFKKVLTHKMLISMFSKVPHVNEIMNKYLNKFSVYSLSIEELSFFTRKIIQTYYVNKNQIWWFSNLEFSEKFDVRKFILLNKFEKQMLVNMINEKQIDEINNPLTNKNKLVKNKGGKQMNKFSDIAISNNLKNINDKYKENKYSNSICKNCELFNNQIVTFDCSNHEDITNVDILFVSEAPDEMDIEKEIPLSGKSGQIFRQYLHKYLGVFKWFITNTCLCKTNNTKPNVQMISNCSNNLDEIIKITNPKLIIALGSTAAKRFNSLPEKITQNRSFTKYGDYDLFVTVHPSYILKNHSIEIYEDDFSRIQEYLTNDKLKKYEINKAQINIDKEFYKEKYSLINIQKVSSNTDFKMLYMFKDDNNNRINYLSPAYYYYYKKYGQAKHIEKISDLELVTGSKKDFPGYTNFESDVSFESRHMIDYSFVTNKTENIYKPNVMFLDIEVLTDGIMPDETTSIYPVVLISYATMNCKINVKECLVLDTDGKEIPNEINGYKLIKFNNERDLLTFFCKRIYETGSDILTAWNISFDIGYIYNRLIRLNINPSVMLSDDLKQYIITVDAEKKYYNFPGLIILDLLTAYKSLTNNSRTSYSLEFISNYELGEGKITSGGKFYELWPTDRNKSILYNTDDVEKIIKINSKLDIIDYFNELRFTACSTWEQTTMTSRLVDNLLIRFMKERGYALRTKMPDINQNKKIGAYVYVPKPGLYDNVYIVDFSRLYPSIIQTFNIGTNTFFGQFVNNKSDMKDFYNNVDREYEITFEPLYNPHIEKMNLKQIKDLIKKDNLIITFYGGLFLDPNKEKTSLFDVLDFVNVKRQYYKKLMKTDPTNKNRHNNKQRSFKEIANSFYGFLGFDASRMKIADLVNNITILGQYINKVCALSFNNMLTNKLDTLSEASYNEVKEQLVSKYWDDDIYEPFILYGDTDSNFLYIADNIYKDYKEAKLRGDKLTEIINKVVIQKYLLKDLNLKENNMFLNLDYKGIGSAYFTNAKKHYVFNCIDGEDLGLSIMGLDIIKSDIPVYTRDRLDKLFNLFFIERKNIDEIKKFIVETENKILEKLEKWESDVGLPVKFNKIVENYKKVPSHILGMLFYNMIVNDTVFKRGTGGYKFKIKIIKDKLTNDIKDKIDHMLKETNSKKNMIDWIVIPETPNLSEIPNFIEIDIDETIDTIWRNRVNLLLSGFPEFQKLEKIKKTSKQIKNEKLVISNEKLSWNNFL